MADIKSQPNDSTEVSLRKAVSLLGNIEDKTDTLVVGELEIKNSSGDPLSVSGTVTANVVGYDYANEIPVRIPVSDSSGSVLASIMDFNGSAIVPISGTVTASNIPFIADGVRAVLTDDEGNYLGLDTPIRISSHHDNPLPVFDDYKTGTISLTNNTAEEISWNSDGVNGFASVVLEITTSGVTWGSTNIIAQACNQTGSPTDQQIMSPLGVRLAHSADTDTGLGTSTVGHTGYVSLEPSPSVNGWFGTSLRRYKYNGTLQNVSLPVTGTRFFIFDLTASRFFLKASFTAGSITVRYRLYRTRHPIFSARRVVVQGEEADGTIRVNGSVDAQVNGSVYMDGGYLDDTSSIQNAVYDAIDNYGVASTGVTQPVSDRGATGMATVTSFTSTTSAELMAENSERKLLTIFNEGAGTLHVLYGNGTASTTNYSVRLVSGDYLEIEKYTGRVMAIFAAAGTARVTQIT